VHEPQQRIDFGLIPVAATFVESALGASAIPDFSFELAVVAICASLTEWLRRILRGSLNARTCCQRVLRLGQ
jgi:hypothetical protein